VGLYDTLILDPPLVCPRCGAIHRSIQTGLLDSSMSTYRPGMLVPQCPVHSGILKERTWCCPQSETNDDKVLELWILIWHGIYAGYALDPEAAQRRLASIDRLDLLEWLDAMQKSAAEWRSRYHAIHADLRDWLEFRDMPKETEGQTPGRKHLRALTMSRISEELAKDPDPLRRILERNAPDQPVDSGLWGW